jgi:hypothetical protein
MAAARALVEARPPQPIGLADLVGGVWCVRKVKGRPGAHAPSRVKPTSKAVPRIKCSATSQRLLWQS